MSRIAARPLIARDRVVARRAAARSVERHVHSGRDTCGDRHGRDRPQRRAERSRGARHPGTAGPAIERADAFRTLHVAGTRRYVTHRRRGDGARGSLGKGPRSFLQARNELRRGQITVDGEHQTRDARDERRRKARAQIRADLVCIAIRSGRGRAVIDGRSNRIGTR